MLATSLGTRRQVALDRPEEFPVEDRLVLARIMLTFMDDFADIDPGS